MDSTALDQALKERASPSLRCCFQHLMVASSIAGGFVLTIALSGAHGKMMQACVAPSPHVPLEFERLYILLTSSVLEEPWNTIKGRDLQHLLKNFLLKCLTRAHRIRVHFCRKHRLLCHLGFYEFEFEFEFERLRALVQDL